MITVALYDQNFITREGIKLILKESATISDWWESHSKEQLCQKLNEQQADLMIINFTSHSWHLIELLPEILNHRTDLKLLAVISDFDEFQVRSLLKQNVKAFLTKECSQNDFHLAIAKVMSGGMFYCHQVIELMQDSFENEGVRLSSREMQVTKLIVKGYSSEKIAQKLSLSIHTVNSHRKKILQKLDIKTPTELVIHAIKEQWIKL